MECGIEQKGSQNRGGREAVAQNIVFQNSRRQRKRIGPHGLTLKLGQQRKLDGERAYCEKASSANWLNHNRNVKRGEPKKILPASPFVSVG